MVKLEKGQRLLEYGLWTDSYALDGAGAYGSRTEKTIVRMVGIADS
jgi:hypothetical protein